MSKQIKLLKTCLNRLRDMRKETIKSNDLDEEELYYLQEGYREGLCSAAMMLAEELDVLIQGEPGLPEDYPCDSLSDLEECWWHTHTDENGDVGTEDRYKL